MCHYLPASIWMIFVSPWGQGNLWYQTSARWAWRSVRLHHKLRLVGGLVVLFVSNFSQPCLFISDQFDRSWPRGVGSWGVRCGKIFRWRALPRYEEKVIRRYGFQAIRHARRDPGASKGECWWRSHSSWISLICIFWVELKQQEHKTFFGMFLEYVLEQIAWTHRVTPLLITVFSVFTARGALKIKKWHYHFNPVISAPPPAPERSIFSFFVHKYREYGTYFSFLSTSLFHFKFW